MNSYKPFFRRRAVIPALGAVAILLAAGTATASPQQSLLAGYAATAKTEAAGFAGFSADRGRTLFLSSPATGKPETPSCTSCHGKDPSAGGQTRAGKAIEPMALSRTPGRYSELKKTEKWFRRNCKSVLGRVCTSLEKGDFLTFMFSQ